MNSCEQITSLSVAALLERCSKLVRQDHECLARLLEVLGEIDRRKVWAEKAYPSMFEFCRETFNMSESTAAKRIWAARVVRKYLAALPMVRSGELHLTGIHRLARYLTQENHRALLDRARNKSTREIELLVAEIAPKPDVPARVRKLPAVGIARRSGADSTARGEILRSSTAEDSAPPVPRPSDPTANTGAGNAPRTAVVEDFPPRRSSCLHLQHNVHHDEVTPLAPARFKLQATINAKTREKIRQLQDLRSHGDPANRDIASILTDAIDLLLTETLRKKAALPARSTTASGRKAKPRRGRVSPALTVDAKDQQQEPSPGLNPSKKSRREPAPANRSCVTGFGRKTRSSEAREENTPTTWQASRKPSSNAIPEDESRGPSAKPTRRARAIPAAVRREVWLRDTGRCTFRADCGRRCLATARLEYHHEVPFARGGKHEPGNISLRCRAHNQYQADLDFGSGFMDRKRASQIE